MTWNRVAFVVAWLMLLPAAAAAKPEHRTALLIGNNLYEAAPLVRPPNDVDTISKALSKCNFNVTQKLNLNKQGMLDAVAQFGQSLKQAGGIGLFYFAGHAVQVAGENYLVPIRSTIVGSEDVAGSCVRLASVVESMESAGNRINLILLESANEQSLGKAVRIEKPGLASLQLPDGFILIAACRPDKVFEDKTSRTSLLTSALAKNLTTPELEIKDMFERVSEQVLETTKNKQDPWFLSTLPGLFYPYYPKLDFYNLLRDLEEFQQVQKTENRSEIQDAWNQLTASYPYWSRDIESKDPMDIIIQAINEDPEGSLFEITKVFEIPLKKTNPIGMTFVYVPPGEFIMGSPFDEPGRSKDENPSLVTMGSGFFIQTTEVTQRQWLEVMGYNPSNFTECGPDCPVENVSWYDAQKFIDRLNEREDTGSYRLPNESEWEYAARARGTGWFCFGSSESELPEYAWYKANSGGRPHPVAQKKPNDWGLFDVHGNVWEWCEDGHGDYRIARGGSWFYPMLFARSANRFYIFPKDRNYTVGFRLVKSP